TADLNADGAPDLLVVNKGDPGSVSVLLGHGDGTFQRQNAIPAGLRPVAVAVADLNGDGRLDLAVANELRGELSVLAGHGDGTFAAAQTVAASPAPSAITATDLNGDGMPDLVIANSFGGTISVLLNFNGVLAAPVGYLVGPGLTQAQPYQSHPQE